VVQNLPLGVNHYFYIEELSLTLWLPGSLVSCVLGLFRGSQKIHQNLRFKCCHLAKLYSMCPTDVTLPSQDSTRINHCYDSANSGCFVERGRCDRRCTQHAKIPSGSSLTSDTYE
jgi:hypothetical protein